MNKRGPLDLLRRPDLLHQWDIVGINAIPAGAAKTIAGSARTPIDQFKLPNEKPSMRAVIIEILYDAQNNDKISHLVLMPLAPKEKGKRIENDDKNLMITNAPQIREMGLDTNYWWRMNQTPFVLDVKARNFGMEEDDKVHKYGTAPHALASAVSVHLEKLANWNILDTMGVIRGSELNRTRGRSGQDYSNFVGGGAGIVGRANQADMRVIEEGASRREAERAAGEIAARAEAKAGKVNAAREMREAQKTTPSGRLALRYHFNFTAAANPDLKLESTFELGLIDEEQLLVLEEVGKKSGITTLRNLYNSFVTNHESAMSDLLELGACREDDVETYKADMEQAMKHALSTYFETLKKPEGPAKKAMTEKTIPFAPEGP